MAPDAEDPDDVGPGVVDRASAPAGLSGVVSVLLASRPPTNGAATTSAVARAIRAVRRRRQRPGVVAVAMVRRMWVPPSVGALNRAAVSQATVSAPRRSPGAWRAGGGGACGEGGACGKAPGPAPPDPAIGGLTTGFGGLRRDRGDYDDDEVDELDEEPEPEEADEPDPEPDPEDPEVEELLPEESLLEEPLPEEVPDPLPDEPPEELDLLSARLSVR